MKRCIVGTALLLALLIFGLAAAGWTARFHRELSCGADRACRAALRADWAAAETTIRDTQSRWDSGKRLTAALGNDEPLGEIDSLFRQLQVYAAAKDHVSYAAACARLAHRLSTLEQMHRLRWENLF